MLKELDIEKIVERKQAGESLRSIAKEYGTSGASLSAILRRRGVTFINPWSEYDVKNLIDLHNQNLPYKEIAARLNKSYDSVKKQCSKLISEGMLKRNLTQPPIHDKDYLISQIKLYVSSADAPSNIRYSVTKAFGSWTKGLEAAKIPGKIGGVFDHKKDTKLYLLNFGSFRKVGITQQKLNQRFAGSPPYVVLDLLETDLDTAVYFEKEMIKIVSLYQFIPEHAWFERNGKTECFILEVDTLEDIFEYTKN